MKKEFDPGARVKGQDDIFDYIAKVLLGSTESSSSTRSRKLYPNAPDWWPMLSGHHAVNAETAAGELNSALQDPVLSHLLTQGAGVGIEGLEALASGGQTLTTPQGMNDTANDLIANFGGAAAGVAPGWAKPAVRSALGAFTRPSGAILKSFLSRR